MVRTRRRVMVLGAGMVGTCTALQLALRGHEVTLIDRGEPGAETSYGNAGLIQREAVEPYPMPRDLRTLLRVAAKRGADVHYHLRDLPGLAGSLWRYWTHSGAERHRVVSQAYARLIVHCLDEHQALIEQAGAQALVRRDGYRWVFREARSFMMAAERARRLAHEWDVRHEVLDGAALSRAEPGLKTAVPGGLHWLDTWSVSDPGALVQHYAALFLARGGRRASADATTLAPTASGTGWQVQGPSGVEDAEAAVIALGPWSAGLVERLGYRYPLFVKRGYHRHYAAGRGPTLPLLDADRGYVLAPMARGLRLTTGAEFARIDAPRTPVQLGRAEALARELFEIGTPVEQEPWMGARPCTGDLLPVVGAAPRHRGLWFNFGHAHQGFTLGPVSGRLLAELMDGEPPMVDPAPYDPGRFG